jgi:hypothetical protein
VANIDHARNLAIGALDALNGQASTQAADYWVGYPASMLEDVIFAPRAFSGTACSSALLSRQGPGGAS